MPTSYWLKFGNTPLGYNGSGVQFTHVEQPGTLTVSLVGTGTGFDNTKNFNVLVTFGSAISYTVDGIPVATPSATCTLTLHAGQSSVIGNIPFGTTYTISENVTDEGYELGSITNPSGTMTDGGAFSSVVTNIYHAPGTLTLTKVVSGTGFDSSKQFEIVITFGRAISYTVDGTPEVTPSDTYTAHLAHNQSVVIGNIPSGVSYSVAETPLSQQDRDAGYSNGLVVGGSGTMTDAGSKSATANNSYVARIPGQITVTNSVAVGGSGFDSTKQFSIVVTFNKAISYTINGTPVVTPSDTCTLSLKNGQSSVIGNIPYKTTYTITETPMSSAEITAGYTNGVVTNSSGTMAENGSVSSTANYTYEEPNTAVISGKRYKTTTINGRVWMAENYTAAIGRHNPTESSDTVTAYWDYGDTVYYNGAVVASLVTNPPTGWHVPTNAEMQDLVAFVGTDPALKLKSTSGWPSGGNGTDAFGFNGKPSGYRDGMQNTFMYTTNYGYWWSSTANQYNTGYSTLGLSSASSQTIYYSVYSKATAMPIRLIKDY